MCRISVDGGGTLGADFTGDWTIDRDSVGSDVEATVFSRECQMKRSEHM